MNTKKLMTASSILLGLVGVIASFLPHELLLALKAPIDNPLPLLIQLGGALYLGLAMTNWSAKGAMIGGIYARPLSLGNFMHFSVAALTLAKNQMSYGLSPIPLALLALYLPFAFAFGYLVFSPAKPPKSSR